MSSNHLGTFFVLFGFLTTATGLIGFDCGGTSMNITTISLRNVEDCAIKARQLQTNTTYIQLLQAAEYQVIPVIQCKVVISRQLFYCGMHSHISAVHNGLIEYLHETSAKQCELMHASGTMILSNGITISGLRVNDTTSRPVVLAGVIDNDGSCSGTQYSDNYGSWQGVVVQASVRITLTSGTVPARISTGKITLKSGTSCQISDGTCLDLEGGYTFWPNVPVRRGCDFSGYDVLYEGNAKKIRDLDEPTSPEIYSLITRETTFALAKTTETRLCGFIIFRTEHPKLFIMETQPGLSVVPKSPAAIENLDIFTYVNSKFVFVEKHIRSQLTSLYNDVTEQKCELERQVLTNALAYATRDPTEFAYTLMKGPGYTAIPSGEVIHLAKCTPIEAPLRRTKKCYNEIPVTFKNQSYFLTPKTRILQRIGSERPCTTIFPPQFLSEHGWIRLMPKPIDVNPPEVLKPSTAIRWKYLSPGRLATSGIYTQQDIDNLKEHLMFPAEKASISNNIMRTLSGKQTLGDGLSAYNMLDEQTIDKIASNTMTRIWEGFLNFGSVSAGFIGIFIVIRGIKLIADTAIRGYALHTVYGCGLHLLGAIWSAATHLMLHLAKGGPSTREITAQDVENNDPTAPHEEEESSSPPPPPPPSPQPPLIPPRNPESISPNPYLELSRVLLERRRNDEK